MFSNGPVIIFKWKNEANWPVEFVSPNVESITGYSVADFLSGKRSYFDIISSEDVGWVSEVISANCHKNIDSFEQEPYRIVGKRGQTIWVLQYTTIVRDETKQISHYSGYLVEITDRMKAESALKESEARYRQMFETNLAIKLIINPANGRIVEANQAAVRFYGYDYSILTQMRIMDLNILSEIEVKAEMEKTRKEERLFFNFRHQLASGEIRDVEVYSGPIKTAEGELLYSIIHDVTKRHHAEEALKNSHQRLAETLAELKDTQEKMVQRERLAAVGQLTAGIAHDFNNILTGILGLAELLEMSPNTPERMREDLQHISNSGQRAAQLVRQLLDFSHKSIRQTHPLDCTSFAEEMVTFLQRTIPENISLHLETGPEDYVIEADLTQLQQLFTNLVVNARDAMPKGGELQIYLKRVVAKNQECCVFCQQAIDGEWMLLQFKDNGCGISPEALPYIFEPFFTTKKAGKGSGLGLAQVSGIVGQHEGHATVESQEERGTLFSFYLPLAKTTKSFNNAAEPPLLIYGKKETILLVEDDFTVKKVSQAMLESLNYQVLSTSSGKEALAIYAEHHDKIALVLSDMIMPDMDGVALFNTLKNCNQELKMVIMSGYPLGEQVATVLKNDKVTWVQKPIPLSQLSQIISKAIKKRKNEIL